MRLAKRWNMLREPLSVLFVSLAALTTLALSADDVRADEDGPVLGCRVTYELEAHPKRGGSYDHVVHLDSACDFALACSIVSDEGHRSEVALSPEGDAAVTIDEGEAKTDFQAKIRCVPVEDA